MATQTVEFYEDGVLVRTETIEVPDAPPSLDERIAALEDAVDTLILDSLGGA